MKKFSFAGLLGALLAVSAWANPSAKWAAFNFEKEFFDVDTTKYCTVDPEFVNCLSGDGLAYYSTLDTNFAVFFYAKSKALIKGTQDAVSFPYQHNAIQVFRYEFMKWQAWGVLGISKDSAQFLIDTFAPATANVEGTYWIKHECLNDISLCDVQVEWGATTNSNLTSSEQALLPTKKKLDDTLSVDSDEGSLWVRGSFENKSASVRGIKLGTPYSVFDLNGVFLGSGIWNGMNPYANRPVLLIFNQNK